ncbi:MAG: NADH:ubiquinone reductase (Na(+)-transporting) subunit C [Flavobacteriales bacterium]|jgi:Na+-transporting NADH:ubiquinone oxidoreductase subunit C|nr:NADH:ubiquinone reductase (Na(+)-transporting) subunit C [Flavobacteriales bacterium]
MAVDKNSSTFTFVFAFVLVVVVGAILASLSMGLKDMQKKNQDDKKRMDILGAIGVEASRENAETLYKEHVKEALVISGKDKATVEAFKVNIRKEYRDKDIKEADRNLPLYICEKEGEKFYVIPMIGKGLWGPVWGYMSIKSDKKTIFGVRFDHQGETPGLGAEIKTPLFTKQYIGEKIDKPVIVVKTGLGAQNAYEVDAITGGTITSKGVEEMFNRTAEKYYQYFQSLN